MVSKIHLVSNQSIKERFFLNIYLRYEKHIAFCLFPLLFYFPNRLLQTASFKKVFL